MPPSGVERRRRRSRTDLPVAVDVVLNTFGRTLAMPRAGRLDVDGRHVARQIGQQMLNVSTSGRCCCPARPWRQGTIQRRQFVTFTMPSRPDRSARRRRIRGHRQILRRLRVQQLERLLIRTAGFPYAAPCGRSQLTGRAVFHEAQPCLVRWFATSGWQANSVRVGSTRPSTTTPLRVRKESKGIDAPRLSRLLPHPPLCHPPPR